MFDDGDALCGIEKMLCALIAKCESQISPNRREISRCCMDGDREDASVSGRGAVWLY
jgi:hypothetical protein